MLGIATAGLALVLGIVLPQTPAQKDDRDVAIEHDVARIATLKGGAQIDALRAFIAAAPVAHGCQQCTDSIFYHEGELRDALLSVTQDSTGAIDAVWYLTLIGMPEDMRSMIQSPPPAKGNVAAYWPSSVACSLLDAASESDWAFLRRCALDEYPGHAASQGAIQTLRLIASPESRELLEEVKKHNPSRARDAIKALRYARSSHPPLTGSELEPLAARIAKVIVIGDWEGNKAPRFNQARDKALIDLQFNNGNSLIYTATFHKTGNLWRLCAVRETYQGFGPGKPRHGFRP